MAACKVKEKEKREQASAGPFRVLAGDFSEWLDNAQAVLQTGKGEAHVSCGTCAGCCRSSMFVHIRPEETGTLQRIPRALLFPAPGLPKGHVLMGYDEKGRCPMLKDGRCSIYEDRPQTCREYDCRIFAATGIEVDARMQAEISERVKAWEFSYLADAGQAQFGLLRETAKFLQDNRMLFPAGVLPDQPAHLAAIAVRVHRLFSELAAKRSFGEPRASDSEIARAILTLLEESEERSGRLKLSRS